MSFIQIQSYVKFACLRSNPKIFFTFKVSVLTVDN